LAQNAAAEQIAQVLERTRQQLIGLGIATPTAEQLAVALMGGVVPTAAGGSQVAGATASPTPPVSTQLVPSALPRFNTSDSPVAAGATSRSPAPTAPIVTPAPAAPASTTSPAAATAQPGSATTGPAVAR
jgi:hypothetical protein